ncbi:MAG TPA: PQQ-binding-like beta-propeller repeat protein [Planctomycetota bacterium]|nr:PQQ-binding-like beta-propeller repeat protein [Planctomycetota bacterium]
MRTPLVAVLSVLLVSGAALAGEALTADGVVARAGVAGGLASFPRASAGDEKLILELARRPAMVVHALARDEKAAAELREAGEKAGLLGRTLYVEAGDAAHLPFADRLVDLMVAADMSEAELTPALRAEWFRVLAPRRGALLVGGTVLRSELPSGSDPWTHRCHGPDNAQVSTDATFKPPFLTQWWALPRQDGFWGTTVVSGQGRMFTVRASRRPENPVILTARSLTSGLVLWQKPLRAAPEGAKAPHGGYAPGRQCIAVAGDTVCLIDRDGVALLDGETGRERSRIAGPKPGGSVKWLAVSDGKLAVLSGDADVIQPITYQTVAANPVGRELAVYDLATGKELWKQTVAGDIDERALAVRGAQLICLAQAEGVVARELGSGKEVWRNTDAAIQANFKTPEQKTVGQLLSSQPVMLALDDVILMRTPWAKEVYALSARDGATLWHRGSGLTYRGLQALPVDGLWLGPGGLSIDLKTGQTAKGPRFTSSGCGPTTSVPGYLITCFGAVSDAKTGKGIRSEDLKSPCDVGSLVSEGIMVTVPSECGCAFEVKCYRALASAGATVPHTAPPAKDRLSAVDTAAPAALALTEADWPTYRHDPGRSGATTASVGEGAKVLWHWKPAEARPYKDSWNPANGPRLAPDFIATAPVAVGGRFYFTSADGVVRCLKADDGKEVWKFATGAMGFAPPTIWEGRALVGGGDGRVYCLDASTGKLLWKMLAAPSERRVFWMGHLVSTWPVTGGVVVADGVGYAAAGYAAENGVHVSAFDPKTGQTVWEKHDAGTNGIVSGGHIAVAEGRLCLAGMSGGSFDLKTGEAKKIGGGYGQEVGALCGKWVIGGARRLTELQCDIGAPINGKDFPAWAPGGTSLPAWDAELVVFGPRGGSLLAVTAEKYSAFRTAPPPPAPAAGAPKPKPPEVADVKLWAGAQGQHAAFALAKDAVVAALAGANKLCAFRRADGTQLWSVDLPEQPAMNRLAIDRDGRVLVGLCDGSVICVGR